MKKILTVLLTIFLLIVPMGSSVAAESTTVPYNTYEYNSFDEAIEAPIGYYPAKILDASRIGLDTPFDSITDMVYKDGIIYILDSKNGRIVTLDDSFNLLDVYSDFTVGDTNKEDIIAKLGTEEVSIVGANGFAISPDNKFYIADTLNNRIICINKENKVEMVILRPDKALVNNGASFSPSKIEIDDKNRIYVASRDIAMGIMIFDSQGEFIQFFGANEVLSTTQAFVKAIRKTFMTVAQMELVEQATPISITNMDFKSDGFLYTVSPYKNATATSAEPGLLKKFNYKGENVLGSELILGDLESHEISKTIFEDVDIDDEGFVNILDRTRGRVFQYTDSGMLISVFGSYGDQMGNFSSPSALESVKKDILVADNVKNCIFVYSPTNYANTIRSAVTKMNNNDLEGSIDEWNKLLNLNSNSYFAYKGLGMVNDYKGDYKTAMKYFKLAYDQDNYALAYQQYREQLIEKYSIPIILIVIAIFVAIMIAIKCLKKLATATGGSAYSKMEQRYTIPFYILLHPIDGCSQFKRRKIASVRFSIGIIIFWLIVRILNYNFTGFAFAINRNTDFNMMVELLLTFGLFIVFVAANWFISILLEGKGNIEDIIATAAYSLIPYIITQGIKVILTNFLVPSENVLITIVTTIGILWTAAVLIIGLMTIHEYSVAKNIWSLILTLVIIVFIVFLIILLYGLVEQFTSFISSIYKEISFRV